MSYIRKILRNAISNWANIAISIAISFSLSPFILNKIGNTYFGVWVVVTQITGYLWLLDFGVRESVVKYVAEYHEKNDKRMLNNIINASLKLYSTISFACIIATIILAVLIPMIFSSIRENTSIARVLVIITGLDIAQTFVFNVFIGILMGLQRYDIFSKISIVLAIIRSILIILFLGKGYGVVAVCLIQFSSNCCMSIAAYFASRRLLLYDLNIRKYGKGMSIYKLLTNYSFFVFLNTIGLQMVFFSSNLVIAMFLPISSVTFFAISANLIEYLKKLIWAGAQAFSPLASELDAKNDPSRIRDLLFKGSKFSLILGLPIAAVFLFRGKQFIGLWMGFEYSEISGNILSVLTITTIFSLPHYTVNGILLGLNKHRLMACCRILEGIANIGLSVLLIKHIGIMGAAFGVAIPHLIMVIFVLPVVVSRAINISFVEYFKLSYFRPMISVVPFVLLCWLAQVILTPNSLLALLGEISLLLPLYILSIWFFGITKDERRLFKGIKQI